jgi:multidrug efflux pump subunit AcrB
MPQRKDPDIPVRVAAAFCSWPGATAQQVEQFITRPIEDAVAENKTIHPGTASDYGIRSVSLPGAAYVYVQLAENVSDVKRQFSDINLKLNALNNQLPQGAGRRTSQTNFPQAGFWITSGRPKSPAKAKTSASGFVSQSWCSGLLGPRGMNLFSSDKHDCADSNPSLLDPRTNNYLDKKNPW